MAYLGDFAVGGTVVVRFNTEDPTGAPITLAGTPVVSVYKNSLTQSTAGVTLTVDYDGVTGLQSVAVDTSADGTFYAAGNTFDVVITTGTVNGISAVGDVVGSFSLAQRVATADVTKWNGTAVATPATAGIVEVNIKRINDSNAAAIRLAKSAGVIVPGTVATAGFSPTTAEFEASDITEATNDHYNGRVIIFTSGNLTDQATSITDYTLTGGRGHFTVVAMTEAPANSDTFIII